MGLRPALNLVGFAKYPIGWSWDECESIYKKDDYFAYETEARRSAICDCQLQTVVNAHVMKRIKRGRLRRRIVARDLLEDALVSGSVTSAPGNFLSINRQGKPIERQRERPVTASDFDCTFEKYSCVGPNRREMIQITLDASSMLKFVRGLIETRGTETKYDYIGMERYCRQLIETGHPDFDGTDADFSIVRKALDDWSAKNAPDPNKIPDRDQLRPLIEQLKVEYGR